MVELHSISSLLKYFLFMNETATFQLDRFITGRLLPVPELLHKCVSILLALAGCFTAQ
jgi:hypothetical protein